MNEKNFRLLDGLISASYAQQALESRRQRENLVTVLLSQRRLPEEGWDRVTIELFLREIASMDSNNFIGAAGVGEREGRIVSSLVRDRYFGLGHGVGRSGDLAAEQPKAAGSSVLQRLANYLALDALRTAGLTRVAFRVERARRRVDVFAVDLVDLRRELRDG
jgi:O-phospho-L-seryl-tRNASec:L-selenocysteinyl-tRNA synthase